MTVVLCVKVAERGVETPLEAPRSPISEAGWHARMSSRFAGKGACARCLSGFPTSGFGRRPTGRSGRRRGRIITRSQQAGAPAFGIGDVIAKVSQVAFGKPLVTNVLRGHVAEAIIALALEPEWNWCSADYAGWDFERADGLRLEVKQSAAMQSWSTGKPSKAIFDVAARTGYWESGTEWIAKAGRPAHLYVFAHHSIYGDDVDHRDPAQWQFYVVPSHALPDVKKLGLATICTLTSPVPISALAGEVRNTASTIGV